MYRPESEGENWKLHICFLNSSQALYDFLFFHLFVLTYLPGWSFGLVASRCSLYRVPISFFFDVSASTSLALTGTIWSSSISALLLF